MKLQEGQNYEYVSETNNRTYVVTILEVGRKPGLTRGMSGRPDGSAMEFEATTEAVASTLVTLEAELVVGV